MRGEGEVEGILTRTLRTTFLSFIDICVAVYDCRTSVQFLEMRPRIGCEKCERLRVKRGVNARERG